MSDIEVEVDDAGFISLLQGIQFRVDDVTPAWPSVADVFAEQEESTFASQGASAGQPWAPLSAPYAAWKATVRPGRPTLVFDGDLRDSLTNRPLGVEEFGPTEATFGTDDHTAVHHQYGTRNMPARPMVHATDILAQETARLLGEFIVDGET